MAKDPFLIEGQAPYGGEIRGEPGAPSDSVVQRDHSALFAFLLGHRVGKGVAQPFDHLEQRQIDVGNLIADENAAAVARQDLLKITQELRQTLGCGNLPRGAWLRAFDLRNTSRLRSDDGCHEPRRPNRRW